MNASSSMDGRALAQTGAVTFNGEGGSLPVPAAPRFTRVATLSPGLVAVAIDTTPYFLLTLESCPDLVLARWDLVATNTPISSTWGFTNSFASGVTSRFYRTFLSSP